MSGLEGSVLASARCGKGERDRRRVGIGRGGVEVHVGVGRGKAWERRDMRAQEAGDGKCAIEVPTWRRRPVQEGQARECWHISTSPHSYVLLGIGVSKHCALFDVCS
jgi:hypothetical protein